MHMMELLVVPSGETLSVESVVASLELNDVLAAVGGHADDAVVVGGVGCEVVEWKLAGVEIVVVDWHFVWW